MDDVFRDGTLENVQGGLGTDGTAGIDRYDDVAVQLRERRLDPRRPAADADLPIQQWFSY